MFDQRILLFWHNVHCQNHILTKQRSYIIEKGWRWHGINNKWHHVSLKSNVVYSSIAGIVTLEASDSYTLDIPLKWEILEGLRFNPDFEEIPRIFSWINTQTSPIKDHQQSPQYNNSSLYNYSNQSTWFGMIIQVENIMCSNA